MSHVRTAISSLLPLFARLRKTLTGPKIGIAGVFFVLAAFILLGATLGNAASEQDTPGGEPTPPLAKAEFIAQADRECRATMRGLGAKALRYGSVPDTPSDVVREWDLSRAEHDQLTALSTRFPATGAESVRLGRFLRLRERVVQLLARAARVENLDAMKDEARAVYQRSTILAREVGLTGCGEDSSVF